MAISPTIDCQPRWTRIGKSYHGNDYKSASWIGIAVFFLGSAIAQTPATATRVRSVHASSGNPELCSFGRMSITQSLRGTDPGRPYARRPIKRKIDRSHFCRIMKVPAPDAWLDL